MQDQKSGDTPSQLAHSFRYREADYTSPDWLRSSYQKTGEMEIRKSENYSDEQTEALLSKHNGWITIESN